MYPFNIDELIFIDIETASCFPSFETMDEDWRQLWTEKTSRSLPQGTDIPAHYKQKAGVMAEFAQIVCVSIGCFTNQEKRKMHIRSFYGIDEKHLLKELLAVLDRFFLANPYWQFAGHNIKEFDIPFLCRRLIIHSIPIPAYLDFQNKKPWETNLLDSFHFWRFGDYKNYTSLKLLAKVLNVPSSKEEMDGSMVGPMFWEQDPIQREKNLQSIAEYCGRDVLATANVFLRFISMPLILQEEVKFS